MVKGKNPYGCWSTTPLQHPWIPSISDVACGYDERLTYPWCQGCIRSRAESPLDQLQALDSKHSEDGIKK